MKSSIVLFIIFGLTFITLSLIVTSQLLESGARVKQVARQLEQQDSLIKASETDHELIKQFETSSRAIERGIIMLNSNEEKLKVNIFLLISNGIFCLALASRIFFYKSKHDLN